MELRLTFTLSPDERAGEGVRHGPDYEAVARELLPLVGEIPDASAEVERGSVGKGAAGYGVDLVLQITEEALNDGASLFAWGSVLWSIVKRVEQRTGRRLATRDPRTISALAAGSNERNRDQLVGATLLGTSCPTGGDQGLGTDVRDVWITTFSLVSRDLYLLFSSPSGLGLGSVVVPPEWTERRGSLTALNVAAEFARLNERPEESDLDE